MPESLIRNRFPSSGESQGPGWIIHEDVCNHIFGKTLLSHARNEILQNVCHSGSSPVCTLIALPGQVAAPEDLLAMASLYHLLYQLNEV